MKTNKHIYTQAFLKWHTQMETTIHSFLISESKWRHFDYVRSFPNTMTSSVRELIIFTQTYKAVLYCQNKEILIVCLNKKCVFYIRDTVVYQVLPIRTPYWNTCIWITYKKLRYVSLIKSLIFIYDWYVRHVWNCLFT